jgi:hypothetical protein
VLHNDLGQVVMNGVFTVSGTLAAPTISGDLALDRANLDASTLLLRLQRPYAVVTADSSPTKPAGASTPGRSTIWDNLTLRLRVLTANNLNLRGENMHLSRETLASLETSASRSAGTCRSARHRTSRSRSRGRFRQSAARTRIKDDDSRSSVTAQYDSSATAGSTR